MKILIRDKAHGLYLAERDRWVADLDQARDFKTGVNALDHLLGNKITGVDLLHVFPDQKHNFAVPLKAFDKAAGSDGERRAQFDF